MSEDHCGTNNFRSSDRTDEARLRVASGPPVARRHAVFRVVFYLLFCAVLAIPISADNLWPNHGRNRLLHRRPFGGRRSEEHTSELQSLMRISYAVFCLKKKTHTQNTAQNQIRLPNTPHNQT